MRRFRKGNILLVFVFLIGFLGVVLAYGYMISGNLRSAGARKDTFAAFYTAEAGLQKAIWYLNTTPAMGGMGTSWRTAGLIEAYGSGSYRMQVQTAPGNTIIITSEGMVGDSTRKVQQVLQASGLPPAFDYALFNNGGLTIKGSSSVVGNVFANGNETVQKLSGLTGGKAYRSPGYSFSGDSSQNGGIINPPPVMPTLDNSPYTSQIMFTKSSDPGVLHGNQPFSEQDFTGQIIYVDGNVTISGSSIGGGGTIVSSGKITVSGNISGSINLYASGEVEISGSSVISQSCLVYAGTKISIPGHATVYGTLLSSYVKINGTPDIYGVIYSWDVGIDLLGTVNVRGSVINPTTQTYSGNINITYDPAYIPSYIPGMTAGGLNIVPHSWKEI